MKDQIKQVDLIREASEMLVRPNYNDAPMIRMTLNNLIDYYHRSGQLSNKRSDPWSQSLMVKKVQRQLLDRI